MDIRRRTQIGSIKKISSGGGSNEGSINTDNYLTIEALEDGLTASLSTNACEYCVDGDGNWKSLAAGATTEAVNAGQTLSFRGNLTPNSSNGVGTFSISKKCNLLGNCMSMLFGDNAADNYSLSGKRYTFYQLFNNCTIVNVSNDFLPATKLAERCYSYMFCNCTSLTTAPELPATTLAEYCYAGMFSGCSSLTTAPALPATTLAYCCYYQMFYGCNKLNYIKMLATDISATNCLTHWVYTVSSTGTFVKNPTMYSLPTGYNGIPSGWTVINDGEESGNGLTFPLYINLNNATQIDENYYEFEPSELSQSLLDWTQEIGLNFDANPLGGSASNDGFINLNSKNKNYKIVIGDYELTIVSTDRTMSDIVFSNEEYTCELCIAKDNSFVEFYIS